MTVVNQQQAAKEGEQQVEGSNSWQAPVRSVGLRNDFQVAHLYLAGSSLTYRRSFYLRRAMLAVILERNKTAAVALLATANQQF